MFFSATLANRLKIETSFNKKHKKQEKQEKFSRARKLLVYLMTFIFEKLLDCNVAV